MTPADDLQAEYREVPDPTASPDEMTYGYCIHCGAYGRGRYRWPINDREEAIDRHVGCTTTPTSPSDQEG
ncbi:hypothetical protein [Kitasatospora sp. NPDC001175]|uniref:hypothetical protein n=1 Tax=Kitasatospora sp. NPDC001175 TaxID=3157103 RepID=UPI003D03B5A8